MRIDEANIDFGHIFFLKMLLNLELFTEEEQLPIVSNLVDSNEITYVNSNEVS